MIGEIEEKISMNWNEFHQWLLANKLTLNASKTEYMLVGTRQRLSQIVEQPQIKLGICD